MTMFIIVTSTGSINGTYKYGNAAFVVILIMYTGMRVSEAIGLQWKDVDMERREIAINQSLAMVKDIEKGDTKIVSELLGHSDVSFTYNVYIDVFEQDKQGAVMKLNQI